VWLQDRGGFPSGFVTMAACPVPSGKVPAAISLYPEAANGGPLSKIRNGDIICVDAEAGKLAIALTDEELDQRAQVTVD